MAVKDQLQALRYALFPPAFKVVIENGSAHVRRGKVPKAFLAECVGVAAENAIAKATLYGVSAPHGIVLVFSSSVSEACAQRFRNVWHIHGR